MEKEKINQMIIISVILMLLIFVIVFIMFSLLNSEDKERELIDVKFNQIYSSEYNLKAIDNNYFIGSYENNKISVIIDNNGKEVYRGLEDVLYDNVYKTKDDNYVFYSNFDNVLKVYLFDGENFELLYEVNNVSYVKPILYKSIDREYLIGFANMLDDDLYIYNVSNNGVTIVDDVILVGDEYVNDVYYTYNDDYLVVCNNDGLMGVIDKLGNVIIDYDYDNILNTHYNSFIVMNKNKYGIIDDDNKELLKINYQAIYYFDDYYIVVNSKNKMALYDKELNNLTGFKMNYDSLLPFDLRGSINSVNLYKVNGKILVLNNYLEDINKTEYDKHNLYIISKGEIQKTISEIGFGFEDAVYTYDKEYNIKVYDNYFNDIFNYHLEDVNKVINVCLVGSDIYQIVYENLNNEENVIYINVNGEVMDLNIGDKLLNNDLYEIYLKKENDINLLTLYDKELNILDSLEGKNISIIGEYIIVDNSIYKIINS